MHKKLVIVATGALLFFPSMAFAVTCYGPSDCRPGQSCSIANGSTQGRCITTRGGGSRSLWRENPNVLQQELSSSSSSTPLPPPDFSSGRPTFDPSNPPIPTTPTRNSTIPLILPSSESSSSSINNQIHIPENPARVSVPAQEADKSSSSESSVSFSSQSSTSSHPSPSPFVPFTITQKESKIPLTDSPLHHQAKRTIEETSAIERIEVQRDGIQMDIDSKAKLFGFIPVSYKLKVSMKTDGSVQKKKPWWTFFSAEDDSAIITELNAKNDSIEFGKEGTGTLGKILDLMKETIGRHR